MEKRDKVLEEQDAPLKNTDRAFVQVRSDGSPGMPQTQNANNQNEKLEEETIAEQQRKEAMTERD